MFDGELNKNPSSPLLISPQGERPIHRSLLEEGRGGDFFLMVNYK